MTVKKWIISSIFIVNIIYATISLRYLAYTFYPELINYDSLHILWYEYYFYPLINKLTFLVHSTSGFFIFLLGPAVFCAFYHNWKYKISVLRWYYIVSLFPLAWPFIFIIKSHGLSISFFIIITIEILWIFLLLKSYHYYKRGDYSLAITFLIYHFCISSGALMWRVCYQLIKFIVATYSVPPDYFGKEHLVLINLNPEHIWYDVSWYISLVLAILLAKILVNYHLISMNVEPNDEE